MPLAIVSAWSWASVGVAIGRLSPAWLSVPTAFLLSYAAYIVPAFYLYQTRFLGLAVADGRAWIYVAPDPVQVAATIGVWAGVWAIFAGFATRLRRCVELGLWSLVVCTSVTGFVGSSLRPIPGASTVSCNYDDPTVCADGAHEGVLQEFHAVSRAALEPLPDELRPDTLDATRPHSAQVLPLAPVDGFTSPAFTVGRDETIATMGQLLFYRCPADDGPRDSAAGSLDYWWRLRHGVPVAEPVIPSGAPWLNLEPFRRSPENGTRLAGLDEREMGAWWATNASLIDQCKLEDIVWPS